MTNFLQETIEAMNSNTLTEADVKWVGSSDGKFAITWDQFVKIANIEYDSGYGGQEIASDIMVVGEDWWLSRHEYDGSEGWEYNSLPVRSSKAKSFTTVKNGGSWASIEDMNKPGGKYGTE